MTPSHTCEHLLVAVKVPPSHPKVAPIPWNTHSTLRSLRKGIDTDVVVAEVRETSRKPDEVYGVIERLVSSPLFRRLKIPVQGLEADGVDSRLMVESSNYLAENITRDLGGLLLVISVCPPAP